MILKEVRGVTWGTQGEPQEEILREIKGTWEIRSFTDIDGYEFQFEGLKTVEQIWNNHHGMWFSEQWIRRLLSRNEDSTNATSILHT